MATWAVLLLAVAGASATPALAQPRPGSGPVEAGAGVALATPLVVDGNGTRVRLGPAPLAELGVWPATWAAGPLRAGVLGRVGTSAVRLEDGGDRWSGGRLWTLELLATARTRPARIEPHVGAGLLLATGPGRVAVVDDLTRRPRLVAEGGVRVRRHASAATSLGVTAQGFRLTAPGGDTGGVLRLLVLVAHAW